MGVGFESVIVVFDFKKGVVALKDKKAPEISKILDLDLELEKCP